MSCTVFKSTNTVDQSINVFPPQGWASQLRIVRNYDSETQDTFTFRKDDATTFKAVGGTLTCAAAGATIPSVDLTISGQQDTIIFKLDDGRDYGYLLWNNPNNIKGRNIGAGAYPDYSLGAHQESPTSIAGMFFDSPLFNQRVNSIDTSNVADFSYVFASCSNFNRSVSNWNTKNGISFSGTFNNASKFNQSLNHLKTGNSAFFDSMFQGAKKFNQPLSNLDVSKGVNFYSMFKDATSFDQDLSNWNMVSAETISYMFANMGYNRPLTWNTPNLQNISGLFSENISFNQQLNLNVAKVWGFDFVFWQAKAFNQDISNWNVRSGASFSNFLNGATSFNQDLSKWCAKFNINADFGSLLNGSGISTENYDKFLNALWLDIGTTRASEWSQRTTARVLYTEGKKYSQASADARSNLIGAGWTITDGGQA